MESFMGALGLYGLGTLALVWPKRLELAAHYVSMGLAVIASLMVLSLSLLEIMGLGTGGMLQLGRYSLVVDGWAAAFLLIIGLSGTAVSIYGLGYGRGYLGARIRQLAGLWNLFLGSMVLVVLAGDAFTFILAWEVMALVSFLLVNHESEKKQVVGAAYQYMVMTHLGTAAILIAFYILGSGAESFAFVDLAHSELTPVMKHIAFGCAFAGFALKSGLMPLHVWLPNAHPAAPSHVSALMSGVMLKVAVYGFGRFVFEFIGADVFAYGLIVMVVGLVSAFLGVLYASMEKDMKRILAYSSVENMGIIFAAFGCGMLLVAMDKSYLSVVAFTAVLVHSVAHSLMKCLLFMSAGAVMHATGTRNVELLGGLLKKMPWTAAFTLIGSMSLASLPFTAGLVGEWLTLQGMMSLAFEAGRPELRLLVIFAFILLGLTGALALGCFVRLYGVAFLGRRRSNLVLKAHEMPFTMLCGMGLEAVAIIAMGIMPAPLVNAMRQILVDSPLAIPAGDFIGLWWNGGQSEAVFNPWLIMIAGLLLFALLALTLGSHKVIVHQDVTWNCGTEPTRRQQYTATGFSKPLRRAFDFILKPRRERVFLQRDHAYFGRKLHYNLMIPDQFTDRLYRPVEHIMVRLADTLRIVQQGSVRLYIGYTMIAMVIVLIWGGM
ncbi:Formate hydrogenlyase subunit 3/Multisubunit Na+/H+ antiporter, MnhD subunit [Selenomonas ruminantium]|uniref:Formate hydrogenlyase subunit 3/Multisubunit Na+/H+ antiporter, MnhD subunit n=1 Tax=Selenomonas ruminantium TaxID=971 RepID=A0A1M6SFG0_SELRU|nr:proton-conducting transporter membrane subunit [Selenomonas ruminantium]SHK43473.1 Formate hydrogenlyase subunit 3/Multisubunit Na+/H+ antiporter, MnhD subunit [Selenomonas ruminantium]